MQFTMEILPFSCGICSQTFGKSESLAAHMKTHSDVNPYKCGICQEGFSELSALTEHIKSHSTDNSFKCHLCHCSLQESSCLNKHLTTHLKSEECCSTENNTSCIRLTDSNVSEYSDQLSTGELGNYPSQIPESILNAVIPTQSSMMSPGEFSCEICLKSFTSTLLLDEHMKVHLNGESSVSDTNGKTYADSANMAQNILTHIGEKKLECSICHKVFNQASNLTAHERTHSGGRQFKCIICHKAFKESGNLRRHMRTHSGEKPFSCDICGKTFSQSTHVVKHKGTHLKMKTLKVIKTNEKLGNKKINTSIKTETMDNGISGNNGIRKSAKDSSKHRVVTLNVIKVRSPTGKLTYKCAVCHRVFNQSGNLARHLRVHSGERPFKCSICSKTFSQPSHLNKHMKTHQNNNCPFNCEICFKGFEKIECLFEHMKIHSSSKLLEQGNLELVPAYMENTSVSTEVTLDTDFINDAKKEIMYDHPLPEYTVPDPTFSSLIGEDCKEIYDNSRPCSDVDGCSDEQCLNLNATDSYYSSNCDSVTTKPNQVSSIHSSNMNPSEVSDSDICPKTFDNSLLLPKHKLEHSIRKPYICNKCGKAFAESGNLSRHMRIHSGIKPYKCIVCTKAFSQTTHLRKHMNMHAVSKPYMCQVCEKSFKKERDLNKHMEIHVEVAPSKCHICDKVFTKGGNLESHLRMHSDQGPLECDVCSKSFSKSSFLNKHKKIHFGGKPFKCDLCGKEFNASGNLSRHLRIHTGEKPYSCKVCGKAFSQTSHVKKHLKTHQEQMTVSIDNVCGSYLSSCNSLTSFSTCKDNSTIATEAVNSISQYESSLLPGSLLLQYSDISRYARFSGDSDLCQCTNCSQSFTVSQYTDHILDCLALNPNVTPANILGERTNETQADKITLEKSEVDLKPDVTACIDNVQVNALGQSKSIFTESDDLSNVINSYCGRQSKIRIKTEVI